LCFIGGDRDMVRAFIPGVDLYETPGAACVDFRGSTILPGIGHWVQQEAPADTTVSGRLHGQIDEHACAHREARGGFLTNAAIAATRRACQVSHGTTAPERPFASMRW
jgi:hypothetical protein